MRLTHLSYPIYLPIAVGRLFASITTYERPVRRSETVLDRLLRLDSWSRPGLSEPEFNRLFATCRCGLVMTRRVFTNHICAMAEVAGWNQPIVIDLTSDADSDSDVSGSDDPSSFRSDCRF